MDLQEALQACRLELPVPASVVPASRLHAGDEGIYLLHLPVGYAIIVYRIKTLKIYANCFFCVVKGV